MSNALDERRAADEIELEIMDYKIFDDYIEARIGDLITSDFEPALLNTSFFRSVFSNLQSKPPLTLNYMSH